MSETIAGQCTPHRRWMLQSKLLPVYFPNTIAKVSNSTVKSNTLVVFVCVLCVWGVLGAHIVGEGGGGAAEGPEANPSAPHHQNNNDNKQCVCVRERELVCIVCIVCVSVCVYRVCVSVCVCVFICTANWY